jgi:hypothetical protein
MQPNCRKTARTVVDAESCGLMVREERHACQTCYAHALDHCSRVRYRRPSPTASKLQRGGEQRPSGRNCARRSGSQ